MRAMVKRVPNISGCADCGMGDLSLVPVDPNTYDTSTGSFTGTPTSTTNGTTTALGITSVLSNAFANIFKAINPVPQGYSSVTTPTGTNYFYTPQGSGVALPTNVGGMSTSTLLLLGGGLLVVMMMAGKH